MRPAVEPLLPTEDADAQNVARVRKQAQIAVDRAETEIGILWLELVVEPLCVGVLCGGHQRVQDRLALLARFAGGHHGTSLIIRIILVIKIARGMGFVKPF